ATWHYPRMADLLIDPGPEGLNLDLPARRHPDDPAATGELLGRWRWQSRREQRALYIERVARDQPHRLAPSVHPDRPPLAGGRPAPPDASPEPAARRCPVCAGPIAGARRVTRRYCDRACQQAAYRARHRGRPRAGTPPPDPRPV